MITEGLREEVIFEQRLKKEAKVCRSEVWGEGSQGTGNQEDTPGV